LVYYSYSNKEKLCFHYLALKWFRCETDIEVVRAEIHEMEADFHNIQTNATSVMKKKE